jgi:hypothetical protein
MQLNSSIVAIGAALERRNPESDLTSIGQA